MPKTAEPRQVRPVTDPSHEPVRTVDQASFHPPLGLDVNLTLCTFLDLPAEDGGFTPAAIVTARLRMKVGMARLLVEGLTKQIAMAEAAESTVN